MIKIDHLNKSFKDQLIFDDLNMEIKDRGIHVIVGASGTGKSTLLNMIVGTEKIDNGSIYTSVKPIMISQNYELLPSLTIRDNLLLGREESELDKDLIAYFKMDEYLDRRPNELSFGQRQRIGIIRTLSFMPSIILCDEPTESLDITNKILVMDLLKEFSKEAMVLLVTHDLVLAQKYGDYFYRLEDHKVVKYNNSISRPFKARKAIVPSRKDMRRIFKVLELPRDIVLVLWNISFFIVLALFILLQYFWFKIPETTDTHNHNYMYLERTYGYGFPYQAMPVSVDSSKVTPTFRFQSLYNGKRYYKANIYPDPLEHKGVIINDKASDLYDLKLDDEVVLYYLVDGAEYPYRSTVTKIIEEPDIDDAQLYYDHNDFVQYLKTVPYDPTYLYLEANEIPPEDQAAYLDLRPSYFALYIPYTDQEAVLDKFDGDIDIIVTAPLLQQRQQFLADTAIYRLIYKLFEVILLLAVLILIFVYLHKDLKRIKDDYAILISQNMDIKYLKGLYALSKIIAMYLSSLGLIIIVDFILKHAGIQMTSRLILLEFYLLYLLSIIIFILFSSSSIKKDQVAKLLKDRFD